MQGQRQQHAIPGTGHAGFTDGVQLRYEIGVAKRDALGQAGRPGGVEQRRDIVGPGVWELAIAVRRQRMPAVLSGIGIQPNDRDVLTGLPHALRARRVGEYPAHLAVIELMGKCFLVELHVHRRHDPARAHDGQGGDDPLRPILGEQRDRLARPDACTQTPGQALGLLADEAVGPLARPFAPPGLHQCLVAAIGHGVDQRIQRGEARLRVRCLLHVPLGYALRGHYSKLGSVVG